MGAEGSKQPVNRLPHDPSSDTPLTGLENFGNTCYVNSVVQALYYCVPFREEVLRCHAEEGGAAGDDAGSLLSCLGALFSQMSGQKRRHRRIAPRQLIQKMRALSPLFASNQQQDAHEFLTLVLNDITETLRQRAKQRESDAPATSNGRPLRDPPAPVPHPSSSLGALPGHVEPPSAHADPCADGGATPEAAPGTPGATPSPRRQLPASSCSECPTDHSLASAQSEPSRERALSAGTSDVSSGREARGSQRAAEAPTMVQALFEGQLVSETRCLTCESVTSKEEATLGMSVDVRQNVSLCYALAHFSQGETLERDNKFHCNPCHSLQEARRSLRIKKAPPVLALHLKRFKYIEDRDGHGRHCKLSCRVPFPLTLRLPVEGAQADDVYRLFAVVIHLGGSPHMGHYVCIARTGEQWVLFDDDVVSVISERDLQQGYGVDVPTDAATSTGYLLFYASGVGAGADPDPAR